MSDFLSQGGYGFYIWSSYGVSAAALVLLTVWALASLRQARARLTALSENDEETP